MVSRTLPRMAGRVPARNLAPSVQSQSSSLTPMDFSTFSFVFRENRVPYYQRLFQNNDGVRQWKKVRTLRVLKSRSSHGQGKPTRHN
ncbi:hypothetical protein McanCB21832_004680 [Microsporum canis]